MDRVTAALCLLLAMATAVKVDMTGNWKANTGWEVICSWTLAIEDKVQSVRLYRNNQQFVIYRPETNGKMWRFTPNPHTTNTAQEYYITVDCYEKWLIDRQGHPGRCVMVVEPFREPTTDMTLKCEVSGERPAFLEDRMEYSLQVPPSEANITVLIRKEKQPVETVLNCTSSGIPAPTLVWNAGDEKTSTDAIVGGLWDPYTKLWHTWSSITVVPSADPVHVTCTPEVRKNGEVTKGLQAEYTATVDSAGRLYGFHILTSVAIIFALLR